MNREAMVAELRAEIDRLHRVLALLEQGGDATGAVTPQTPASPTDRRRQPRTPEMRARMAEAARKRWKARKAAAKRTR